ncbi:SDR family NAD(P)-dependent oxidoreductase, partial [Rhizobium johnstonii]
MTLTSANPLGVFDLTGRVAVVTGGTRGLGRGFADVLGHAGATVVIVGRDQDAGNDAVRSLADDGVTAAFQNADVTRPDDVRRVLDETLRRFGRVDVLVNNAGACVHAPALEVTPEDWRHVMDVNLDAV